MCRNKGGYQSDLTKEGNGAGCNKTHNELARWITWILVGSTQYMSTISLLVLSEIAMSFVAACTISFFCEITLISAFISANLSWNRSCIISRKVATTGLPFAYLIKEEL